MLRHFVVFRLLRIDAYDHNFLARLNKTEITRAVFPSCSFTVYHRPPPAPSTMYDSDAVSHMKGLIQMYIIALNETSY